MSGGVFQFVRRSQMERRSYRMRCSFSARAPSVFLGYWGPLKMDKNEKAKGYHSRQAEPLQLLRGEGLVFMKKSTSQCALFVHEVCVCIHNSHPRDKRTLGVIMLFFFLSCCLLRLLFIEVAICWTQREGERRRSELSVDNGRIDQTKICEQKHAPTQRQTDTQQ